MITPAILDRLACPICKKDLVIKNESLFCPLCEQSYDYFFGKPLFVKPEYPKDINDIKPSFKKIISKIYSSIPNPTICTDKTMFNFLNQLPEGSLILNLGSGIGQFDNVIVKPMINLDIMMYDRTDIVADAHYLPFKDASLDCVFSNAVLEHVKRPWDVATEITRVVKPGGYVVINLPFLNTIHDEHDYFRFTLKGIHQLFPAFEELYEGVSGGGGSFIHLCNIQYLKLFIPTKTLRFVIYFIWSQIFFRLKYLDFFVKRNPDYSITATSFYFIGKKKIND